jgi:hypothetical protein
MLLLALCLKCGHFLSNKASRALNIISPRPTINPPNVKNDPKIHNGITKNRNWLFTLAYPILQEEIGVTKVFGK